jgi:hypothetical protein
MRKTRPRKRDIGDVLECSICGGDIDVQPNGWADGNNAEPVNDGRCCDFCNWAVVIPARIREYEVARAAAH